METLSLDFSASEDDSEGALPMLGRSHSANAVGRYYKANSSGKVAPPEAVLPKRANSCGPMGSSPTRQSSPPKCTGCSIVAMDSNTFFGLNNEMRAVLMALTAHKDSQCTVIDLDACHIQNVTSTGALFGTELLNAPQSMSVGVSSSESAEDNRISIPKWGMQNNLSEDCSGLSDQLLFQRSNVKVFSDLITYNETVISKYQSALQLAYLEGDDIHEKICLITMHYNRKIEQSYHLFWSEVLLREIANNFHHYPSSDVFALDLKAMAATLLKAAADEEIESQYGGGRKQIPHQKSLDMDQSNGSNSVYGAKGVAYVDTFLAALQQRENFRNVKNMSNTFSSSCEDTEQHQSCSNHSNSTDSLMDPLFFENLLFVFYSEFLLKNATCNNVMRDLLMRHKDVLVKWAL
mmetsp:Transcript_29343/g.41858  ORF Transcript_29343/g.41858 Transcript_29343/m.41858 type:complete len:406 (+) Transcript_29343:2-1219(+)